MHSRMISPLRTASEKHWLDKECTSRFGIPSLLLMENASRSALQAIVENIHLPEDSHILIFMGNGNNGGDGVCLGRHLVDLGHHVLVCHTKPLEKLPSPAKEHVEIAQKAGVLFRHLKKKSWDSIPQVWHTPPVIIDALYGIGFKGNLHPNETALVCMINSKKGISPIVALDAPTGLDQENGLPAPVAVQADLTLSFGAPLPVLYLPEIEYWTGKVITCDFGLPRKLLKSLPLTWALLNPQKKIFRRPPPSMHKGSAGKILILGGSDGMHGAPVLSALAALRTGCGTAHLLTPGGLPGHSIPEIQTTTVGTAKAFSIANLDKVLKIAHALEPDAMIIGPGLGRAPETADFLDFFLQKRPHCPTVLDADALWIMGQKNKTHEQPMLHYLRDSDILTPHPGEMTHLLPEDFFMDCQENDSDDANNRTEMDCQEYDSDDAHTRTDVVQANRSRAILNFCQQHPACLVLKGAGTLIKQRDSPTILSPFAVPSLAVGGSGDVLGGVIATLCAAPFNLLDAVSLGVFLHARAGLLLQEQNPRGHLAGEIANAIPLVMKELYI